MDGTIKYPEANTFWASAEVLDCRTCLVSKGAPYGAVTVGELSVRGFLHSMRLDTKQRRFLEADDNVVPDAYFFSDGEYGNWKMSPGHQTIIQASCLVIANSPGPKVRTTMENGGELLTPSTNLDGLLILASPSRTGTFHRISLVSGSAIRPPFWWEQCKKTTVTIV